jgi:hypothetical protein
MSRHGHQYHPIHVSPRFVPDIVACSLAVTTAATRQITFRLPQLLYAVAACYAQRQSIQDSYGVLRVCDSRIARGSSMQ